MKFLEFCSWDQECFFSKLYDRSCKSQWDIIGATVPPLCNFSTIVTLRFLNKKMKPHKQPQIFLKPSPYCNLLLWGWIIFFSLLSLGRFRNVINCTRTHAVFWEGLREIVAVCQITSRCVIIFYPLSLCRLRSYAPPAPYLFCKYLFLFWQNLKLITVRR